MEGFEQRSGAERLTFEKSSSGWCVEQSRAEVSPKWRLLQHLGEQSPGLEQSCGSGLV